ncbi:MAG: DUF4435 domain-containing protein [Spirochaetes bacterium]|nr:DUF4435 domain-containing protein [Spirochaetota bacterium]
MVNSQDTIPSFSDTYLYAQDIFFYQFNELNFYVEDTDSEEFYFQIFRKLFEGINIEKIFPLNGKKNVINHVKENNNDKKKVYIVDKDFDDLHNIKESYPNLFYLDKFCIENYLFEKKSIIEFVVSENPILKHIHIEERYNVSQRIEDISEKLVYLKSLFFLVQKYQLPFENTSLHIECFLKNNKTEICLNKLGLYKDKLINHIEQNNLHIDLERTVREIEEDWRNKNIAGNNINGKYILFLLMNELKIEFELKRLPNHCCACYNLAKECEFESLNYLKESITEFIA